MRNVFNIKKVRYVEKTQKVIYQGKMKKGKDRKNFEVFSALDFIASITQHIPDRFSQLVRYYGLCKAMHNPYNIRGFLPIICSR